MVLLLGAMLHWLQILCRELFVLEILDCFVTMVALKGHGLVPQNNK